MIDVKAAYEMAKKKAEHFSLGEVRETEEMWIFCFYKRSNNGLLYPQAPNITVSKDSGEIGNLVIPPIENLQIFHNAKVVNYNSSK